MPLYERILGSAQPKISPHTFMSVMQEYMLGNVTGAQAATALGLDAVEQADALALRDRLLTESSANASLARRLKAIELENVLILAESGVHYTTVAAIKARLGVV